MGLSENQGDADVIKLREIVTGMYKDAKKSGVPVRAFRDNYFPNQLKEEYIKYLGSDIFKIIEKDPKFEASKINRQRLHCKIYRRRYCEKQVRL